MKPLSEETKQILRDAMQYCEDHGKSLEFTLQYMQDVAKVDLQTVMDFLKEELAR